MKIHDYSSYRRGSIYLLIPMVAFVMTSLGFLMVRQSLAIAVFLFLFASYFLILSLFGSIYNAAISIDSDGISTLYLGHQLKHIDWNNVTKIRKFRRWNAGSHSYQDVYCIFDTAETSFRTPLANLRGPILFYDKIGDLSGLLEEINRAAIRFHLLLVVVDHEASKTRSWRSSKQADEIAVTAF